MGYLIDTNYGLTDEIAEQTIQLRQQFYRYTAKRRI